MDDDLLAIEALLLAMTEDTFKMVLAHMSALTPKTIDALRLLLVSEPGEKRPSAAQVARMLDIPTPRLSESLKSFSIAHEEYKKKNGFVDVTYTIPACLADGMHAQEKYAISQVLVANPNLVNKPTRKK